MTRVLTCRFIVVHATGIVGGFLSCTTGTHHVHNDESTDLTVALHLKRLRPQDIAGKWTEMRELVPHRDQTLQQEMMRQQNNERLRRQFAVKANVVGQWIENQLDLVASIGLQIIGCLEEQLKKLHVFDMTVVGYKSNMEELEHYSQVCRCLLSLLSSLSLPSCVCVCFMLLSYVCFLCIYICVYVSVCCVVLAINRLTTKQTK